MKIRILLLTSAIVLLSFSDRANAQAGNPPKTLFLTSNVVPPPNGIYVETPTTSVAFPNGIVLSNILAHDFIPGFPPPPAGLSVTHTFHLGTDFDISFDHGSNFVHASSSNICTVNLQGMSTGNSGPQSFDTEMLQLDISGGNIPSAVMIRESPTLKSTGQTQINPTAGGFFVSSFFDVFTELSTDGGQTWLPAVQSVHLDLRVDPTRSPPTAEPSALMLPPDDFYVSGNGAIAFANGVMLNNLQLKYNDVALNPQPFPPGPPSTTLGFNATLDCMMSLNGGLTFNPARIPAVCSVTFLKLHPGVPITQGSYPPAIYDTEITQMNLAGGDLPANMTLRESPTLGSYGGATILSMADGSFQISSFFDVFMELQLAGSGFQPQTNPPVHLEVQRPGLQYQYSSPNHPPTNSSYFASTATVVTYSNTTFVISNLTLIGMVPSFAPPPVGPPVESFTGLATMMVSSNGGQSFFNASAPANMMVSFNPAPLPGSQYYDTEMLQMDIVGGTLPPGMHLRESPTKSSLGRASITQVPGAANNFRIDSFFDVFTELSLDSAQTWRVQNSPAATIALNPTTPPIARLGVLCPPDISVNTGDPSGAYVTYSFGPQLFPDCPFGPFPITCVPPSGSKFPLGTTTVTCTRTDGCGEHATCTFNVTVKQTFIWYNALAHSAIGSATLNVVNTGAPPYTLVISNLGAGGNDGAHLNLGSAEAIYFQYAPFTMFPPHNYNTCVIHQATGPYDLALDHVLGIGTFFGGSNAMIRADFASIGATQVLAQVMDESNHLIQAMIIPNASWINLNNVFPPPCSNYDKTAYTYAQGPGFIWYRFCMYGCNCIGTNCYIERVVCFRPDIAVAAFPKFMTGMDVLAQGPQPPGTLTFLSEQLGKFGNQHEPLGMTMFGSQPGLLFADSIGGSGGDGLAIDLKDVSHFDLTLAPTRDQVQGACLSVSASGTFNGQTNFPLGLATLAHGVGPGGGCEVAVDFSSIGASQVKVDIYSNAQFVGTIAVPTGHVGTVFGNGNIIGCGKLGPPLPCYWLRIDAPFIFQSPTGPTFQGDEIRLLAANPAGQIQSLSQFRVQGCGLGQFVVTSESNSPPVEVDTFPLPQAQMTLVIPIVGGGTRMETVNLTGTATIQTMIGPDGSCGDSNNNGLDDAVAQMTSLTLSGNSSLGPIQVTLDGSQPTMGLIEEQANLVPGILDVPPFTPGGTAKSFFDVFFDFNAGGTILHNGVPLHMTSIITHKPPGPGDTFTSVNTSNIDLLTSAGQPSGFQLVSGVFVPNCIPPKITVSSTANGKLTFCWPALCGTAFQVQCTTNLIPPINWVGITNVIQGTNGNNCVTVDITGGGRFYRIAR
jgi:hypothetical protein